MNHNSMNVTHLLPHQNAVQVIIVVHYDCENYFLCYLVRGKFEKGTKRVKQVKQVI